MNTVQDTFYFVEDVMKMLGLSRSKCYKVIRQLNQELEERGCLTFPGRVLKRYYHKRLYGGPDPVENLTQPTGRKRTTNNHPADARR